MIFFTKLFTTTTIPRHDHHKNELCNITCKTYSHILTNQVTSLQDEEAPKSLPPPPLRFTLSCPLAGMAMAWHISNMTAALLQCGEDDTGRKISTTAWFFAYLIFILFLRNNKGHDACRRRTRRWRRIVCCGSFWYGPHNNKKLFLYGFSRVIAKFSENLGE